MVVVIGVVTFNDGVVVLFVLLFLLFGVVVLYLFSSIPVDDVSSSYKVCWLMK